MLITKNFEERVPPDGRIRVTKSCTRWKRSPDQHPHVRVVGAETGPLSKPLVCLCIPIQRGHNRHTRRSER